MKANSEMGDHSGDSIAVADVASSDPHADSRSFMPPQAREQATLKKVIAVLDEVEATIDAELNRDEVETVLSDDRRISREQLRQILDLSLIAGQLLLENGADTHRVEETVHELGIALGCDWLDILVSPSTLIITASYGAEHRTKVRCTARFGGVNMDTLAGVSRVSERVKRGELNRLQARNELNRINNYRRSR